MKVLIDTNVLVSAILRDKTPEEVISWIISQEDWVWVVTPEIVGEYKEVLARPKFGLSPEILQKWYSIIDRTTQVVKADFTKEFNRGPKDAKFLIGAIAASVDYLITGDRDFGDAERISKTLVLSVTKFKKLIVDFEGK